MSQGPTVHERIAALLLKQLNVEVPTPDTDLFQTGILDSLAFVDLLAELEQEFGITLSLDELEIDNFRSIGKIAAFVVSRNGWGEAT